MIDPFASHENFTQILKQRAAQAPDRVAYTFLRFGSGDDETLSYGQLAEASGRLAQSLARRFEPGERALLLLASGLEFPVAFFACLQAGIVPAPLYPPQRNQKLDRLESVLADAAAALALVDDRTLQDLRQRERETGERLPVPVFGANDLIAEGVALEAAPLPQRRRDDIAFLQYTSGSTGTPKGVMVSHGNLLANSEDLDRGWGHSPDSVMVTWLPLFHDLGLIYGLLQPLYKGFPAVVMAPFSFLRDPLRWLESITRFRGTHSAAPNFAYDMCVERATPKRCEGLDLSSWRMSMNAAEPIHRDTLLRFYETFEPYGYRRLAMTPGFGLAEATLKVTSQRWDRPAAIAAFDAEALEDHRVVPLTDEPAEDGPGRRWLVGCGGSEVDTRVVIVDPHTTERLEEGRAGEVWAAGESIAQGYWNRPEITEETFGATLAGDVDDAGAPRRYMRTGDLGFLHEGELYIAGRLKDLVIIRGRNYYPQDIERVVADCHPGLRSGSGVAFSVEVGTTEELVVVQEIHRRAQKGLDEEELLGNIRRAVAEAFDLQLYAIQLVSQSSVAKTSSGKLQRRLCRDQYLAGEFEPVVNWQRPTPASLSAVASTTVDAGGGVDRARLVERLAPIFEQVLGLSAGELRSDEPVSRYGMSSQVAVRLSGILEEELQRSVPATLLYDHPTVDAVAAFLSTADGGLAPADIQSDTLSDNGSAPSMGRGSDVVAVIGIGCRLPGARGKQEVWKLLEQGVNAVAPPPAERARLVPGADDLPTGGYLSEVDLFDAERFGISARELERMDPQQRLLLEVAVEALEDAALHPTSGNVPGRGPGNEAGVFVGISTHDYERLQVAVEGGADAYSGTGNASSIAANRLSFALDLRGPSVAVDTACSSSLVALHLARRSLAAGECRWALAGGVNLMLDSTLTVGFRDAHMMAVDGRCKTFDAAADGYGRGEGCAVLVLKPLAAAQRDGDPILGVLHGSAVNQDGRSNGLTAPNGPSQEVVVRRALADAGVGPEVLGYVEAHGTGTPLGDPIELGALRRSLAADGRLEPCAVGSVKTNIGHLEAAAGVAGVVKVLLSLEAGQIPPHLHLDQLNPEIDLGPGLTIPTELTPWPRDEDGQERWAGVSSFGFGGTNAHLIVGPAPSEAPREAAEAGEREAAPGLYPLPLSAAAEPALRQLAESWVCHPALAAAAAPWPRIAASAALGRAPLDHRLVVVAANAADARGALERYLTGAPSPAVLCGRRAARRPRIGFLFTGQGAQTPGMGSELYASEPVFRAAIDRCAESLQRLSVDGAEPVQLTDLLFPSPEAPAEERDRIHQTAFTQVALFAFEYALAQLLEHWGVVPAAVIGHSIGEYVAATRAGVMSLDDALALVATRGQVMQALPAGGAMVTLFTETVKAEALIREAGLSVAAINAPRKVVASGAVELVESLEAAAAAAGVETRRLKVSHAFHSPLMDPALAPFETAARRVSYRAPQVPLYSNLTGALLDAAPDAAYWCQHLRNTVRFADGMAAMMETCDLLLEVGPRPVLTSLAAEIGSVPTVPTLKAGQPERRRMLNAIAQLYCAGAEVDWIALFAPAPPQRIAGLPTYPFQRTAHWFEPLRQAAALARKTASGSRPQLIPYDQLKDDHELEARLRELAATYGLGAGSVSQVTGKSLLWLGSAGDAYCFLAQRGSSVFALDYTGAPDGWPEFVDELHEAVRNAGLELSLVEETAARLPQLRQRGFTCTTVGTWQDLDELADFGLGGRKMRRLRYLVNRYESEASPASPARVWEVAGPGIEPMAPELERELVTMLREWAAAKGMAPRFAEHIEAAVLGSPPLSRHRTFAVQRHDRVDGAIMILPAPALDGYLMDMEFYRADAGLGWVEFGIAGMLAQLVAEGANRFSLGLTLGTQIEAQEGDEPVVREFFQSLHDEGLLDGDANFQFKSKFRPTTHSSYLCRAPEADPSRGVDFVAALDDPFAPVDELQARLTAALSGPDSAAAAATPLAGGDPAPSSSMVEREIELAEGGPVFESLLSTERYGALGDHRVGGAAVLPATAYGEMAWAVAHRLGRPAVIRHLALAEVLPVPDDAPRRVQITARAAAGLEEDLTLSFASRPTASAGDIPAESWTRHGEVVLAAAPSEASAAAEPRKIQDLDAVRERLGEPRPADPVYRHFESLGLGYGPAFRRLRELWVGEREVLARLEVPEEPDGAGAQRRAALLDGGLQAFFPLAGLDTGHEVLLPVRLEELSLDDDRPLVPGEDLYAHVEVVDDQVAEPVLRLHLAAADGAVLASCHRVRLRRVELAGVREQLRRRLEGCLFLPTWHPVAPSSTAVAGGEHWLLLSAPDCLAAAEGELRQALGSTATLATATFDHAAAAVMEALEAAAGAAEGASLRVVIHGPDDTRGGGITNGATVVDTLLEGSVGATLAALGALDSTVGSIAGASPARLAFIASGGGALAGLARVVEREYPQLWGGSVELAMATEDPSSEPDSASWRTLVDTLRSSPAGPRRWRRGESENGMVEELRCEPAGSAVVAAAAPRLDEKGLYLITGGWGALGLAVASRWVDLGARRLLLLGRSAPDASGEAAIAALRQRGATVELAAVDVADGAALGALLEPLGDELRGVVHAAGVLDDGVLTQQNRERFQRVLAAKVAGAWNLHRWCGERDPAAAPLDHFLLFSSVSSLLGTPGQGNYAAANAFLDALAVRRETLGLPATSIQWGPWASVGMAAADLETRHRALGVRPLEVSLGLAALEAVLASASTSASGEGALWTVLDIEAPAFLSGPLARLPVLATLAEIARQRTQQAPAATPAAAPSLSVDALAQLSEDERQQRLITFLSTEIARAVGLDVASLDPLQPTDQLGIDSLVVMELRNRIKADLGVEIPASRFFEFPSIDTLAQLLRDRLLSRLEASEGAASTPPTGTEDAAAAESITAADVDEMSGEDVDALLAQLLEEGEA